MENTEKLRSTISKTANAIKGLYKSATTIEPNTLPNETSNLPGSIGLPTDWFENKDYQNKENSLTTPPQSSSLTLPKS